MLALAHPYCHEAQRINPWLFMDFTSQALPIEARHVKYETIEAALLHAQRHTYIFRAPTMPGLWADVGAIVGMSQDLGLNIDATGWKIPDAEKKGANGSGGRPSHLHDDQHDVEDLQIDDFIFDPRASGKMGDLAARVYVAAARLTVILSDILSKLYTVRGAKKLYTLHRDECVAIADAFLGRLQAWKDEYMAPLADFDVMHDPTGNLQLAYYTVEITLYRAILRTAAGSQFRQRSGTLVRDVTRWLKNLQVNCLSGFWWLTSRIAFAITGGFMIGMLLSATEDDEVNHWIQEITTYRELLKAHSLNFNMTKLASIRMDLLLQRDSSDSLAGEDGDTGVNLGQGSGTKEKDEELMIEEVTNYDGDLAEVSQVENYEALREDFPVDPAVAFGNTYGLEWDTDLDQLLSSFDYNFDR
ncbi:unnamed protein product [Parascedosporium putredinis]|uniref:Transcription factor domain-containing protein n=1 Tax=Parascedosporium putredinis TaxID=1442378 RepID=A0A9P1HAU5_9PEZI|nr:unnamed protein product [Parascedosporium putredinis]CAI8001704.1 unnamed protein product [Parascedosporium putredinis]